MENLNKVYLTKAENYDKKEIKEKILWAIDEMGGVAHFLERGKNVVVKPNLVMRKSAEVGATTHPTVIEAVCEIFAEAGADVTICESSGGLYNSTVMNLTYKTCGMTDAAKNSGAKLCDDFSETTLFREENEKCKAFAILTPIANADVIVDVCKLKTHTIATMSGAVKNMFGSIPGIQKVEMHARFPEISDFADMLVDLCLTVKPALCITDAIDAMEGNGPTAGEKVHFGALLVSENAFATDVVLADLAKIDRNEVPTLVSAKKRGICDEAEVLGESVKELEKALRLPDTKDTRFELVSSIFGGRVKKWLTSRPKVNKNRCRGCGECVKNCPMHLISLKNGKAHIKNDGCIHCFCCHELCRFHAVDIKKPFISKM